MNDDLLPTHLAPRRMTWRQRARRRWFIGSRDRRGRVRTPGPLTLLGDRVRLVRNDDDTVPPGTLGWVYGIDSLGVLHVRWDCGVQLGLVPDDEWEVVPMS